MFSLNHCKELKLVMAMVAVSICN